MIIEEVFPLRLGPSTSVDRCDPLDASPLKPRPKYTPSSVFTEIQMSQKTSKCLTLVLKASELLDVLLRRRS